MYGFQSPELVFHSIAVHQGLLANRWMRKGPAELGFT